MKRPPEFKKVRLGDIVPWGDNPRRIDPEKLKLLARSIEKYGLFQSLTVWERGDGKYETGGGNMRYRAMTEILRWPPEREIVVAVTYPESEAEKIELSILDNQAFGFYDELKLAELVGPVLPELETNLLAVDISPPVSLEGLVSSLQAALIPQEALLPEDQIERMVSSGWRAPIVLAHVAKIGPFMTAFPPEDVQPVLSMLEQKFGITPQDRQRGWRWILDILERELRGEGFEPKESRWLVLGMKAYDESLSPEEKDRLVKAKIRQGNVERARVRPSERRRRLEKFQFQEETDDEESS